MAHTTQTTMTAMPIRNDGRLTRTRMSSRRARARSEIVDVVGVATGAGSGLGAIDSTIQRSASSRIRGFIQAMMRSAIRVASM